MTLKGTVKHLTLRLIQILNFSSLAEVPNRLSCLTLCDTVDCHPRDSSVHEILQARILEWVAMPSSRGSSQHRGGTHISYVSCIGRRGLFTFCVC